MKLKASLWHFFSPFCHVFDERQEKMSAKSVKLVCFMISEFFPGKEIWSICEIFDGKCDMKGCEGKCPRSNDPEKLKIVNLNFTIKKWNFEKEFDGKMITKGAGKNVQGQITQIHEIHLKSKFFLLSFESLQIFLPSRYFYPFSISLCWHLSLRTWAIRLEPSNINFGMFEFIKIDIRRWNVRWAFLGLLTLRI